MDALASTPGSEAYYDSIRTRSALKAVQYGDVNACVYGTASRSGGHYIDVGNVENIVEGRVRVRSDGRVIGFTSRGLEYERGVEGSGSGSGGEGEKEELEADVIVFATGFKNDVREIVAGLCGEDVERDVEDYWGVDTEGEIWGAYKPSGRE